MDKDKKNKKKKHRKHHHHHHKHSHFTQDELELRRTKGSEVAMEDYDAINKMAESSEEEGLEIKDREDLYHQRFDHMAGIERHKIQHRKKSSITTISGPMKFKVTYLYFLKNLSHNF